MDEVVRSLADGWGSLRFAVGLLLLPALYLKEAADVHREVGSALRDARDRKGRRARKLRKRVRRALRVFELEWWLLAAIVIFLIAVFQLSSLAEDSTFLTTDGSREYVRGALNAYGTLAGLLGTFYVLWSKASAYRALRALAAIRKDDDRPQANESRVSTSVTSAGAN